ncbi:MAG TPA: YciI family protein [Acidobacteriaceae bacterium]
MPHYMLLLHDDRASLARLGPEEMQRALEKYVAWRKKPFVVDGRRLNEQTGKVMQKRNGSVTVTDGPYTESREVLGGYYTIEAVNLDEALQLSLDHPHVDFGSIEIREVMPPAG